MILGSITRVTHIFDTLVRIVFFVRPRFAPCKETDDAHTPMAEGGTPEHFTMMVEGTETRRGKEREQHQANEIEM